MAKRRPIGITILAVMVGIAAVVALFHTLQFLHILPFWLGPLAFFAFDLVGAVLWGIETLILFWVASSLWNLRMEGRLFVLVIATINLILAFAAILGQSTFTAMFPTIIINALILAYCLIPGVEAAFSTSVPAAVPAAAVPAASQPKPAVAAAAPMAAAEPVMAAAAVPVAAAVLVEEQEEVVDEPAVLVEEPQETFVEPSVEPLEEPEAVSFAAPVMEPVEEVDAAAVSTLELEAGAGPAPSARRKVAVQNIEGIGPVYCAKLEEIGIHFVSDLLDAGASRKGREDLVLKTGISSALILKWVNMADLMRISGIGEEFSELLEYAGVDTVKELRNRNAENLYNAMLEASQQRKMVRRTPHLSEVESWIEQAKQLDPIISY